MGDVAPGMRDDNNMIFVTLYDYYNQMCVHVYHILFSRLRQPAP